MTIVELELVPGTERVIVGRATEEEATPAAALPLDIPRPAASGCRCGSAKTSVDTRSIQ
jgi:hypothetical protein